MRKPKVRGIKRTRPAQKETPESDLQELQRTLDEMDKKLLCVPPARRDELTLREELPLQDPYPPDFGTLGMPGITPLDPEGMLLDLPEVVRQKSPSAVEETDGLLKRPSRKRKQQDQEANKENIMPIDQTGSQPSTPGAHHVLVTSADVHVDAGVSSPKKPRTPKKQKAVKQKEQVPTRTDLDLIEEITETGHRPAVVVEPPTSLIEEVVSQQMIDPVDPIVVQADVEEPFPLAAALDQPTTSKRTTRPKLTLKKLISMVKRKVDGRRDCRFEASDLNERYKSTKETCHDFDKFYDEQSLNTDDVLFSQLPPVITTPPEPPIESIHPEILLTPAPPAGQRSLGEVSEPRRAPLSVRFSTEVDMIEFPMKKGIDKTINDTVAVAGQLETGPAFPEEVVTFEGNSPSAVLQQTPLLLPSIDEAEKSDQQISRPEETPKSRRIRIESPLAGVVDSHIRQKGILSLVKLENRAYTIDEVCPHPVNKFNIACTFGDLLALCGRGYLELVPEEDSSELKSFLWGQRLNK